MTYQVRLSQFEGPLDLLLHLIKRDKINIYDIPISHITQEYLAYIEIMQELELEVAGEFFVMAATLMRIKAQMLLPRHAELEEEEEDPRDELVRNLLEYKKFKEAAQHFSAMEEERRKVFTRPTSGKGIAEESGYADRDIDSWPAQFGGRDGFQVDHPAGGFIPVRPNTKQGKDFGDIITGGAHG